MAPPFHPGTTYPELAELLGESARGGIPNTAYQAVRNALLGADLDADHFGTSDWNPLGALVAAGSHIVLKPNFIRHWNPLPEGTVESVVTHGSVLRAITDYALLAAGPTGRVTVAEAPQMDCNWTEIRKIAGLDELVSHCASIGRALEIIDLRREWVVFENGIIVDRESLPGDPAGYRVVALGERSFFNGSGLDPQRMRGADYDPGPTSAHHSGGRNDYLLSETVLSADLVVNLPKVKTHKKTGVTLSQKNLVGINGDKNWLPHHCIGSATEGGDEYPGRAWLDRARSRATEVARPMLQKGVGLKLFQLARRAESATRGDDFIRAGNWHGNQTTWRMCLDLNRCFQYSNAAGFHDEADAPVRAALHVLDGIVAGDDNGPLAPRSKPLGAVIASTDPVAADLVAVRLMGFDEARLPMLREAMSAEDLPITAVRDPDDVEVMEVRPEAGTKAAPGSTRCIGLDEINGEPPFLAHPGWRGHVERAQRAPTPANTRDDVRVSR